MTSPNLSMTRPIWAEVSRPCLAANFGVLTRQTAGRADLLCVVKANAYGHGVEGSTQALVDVGASWLGVTSVEEGVALRQLLAAKSAVNIVVLGGIAATNAGQNEARALVAHGLAPVAWTVEHLDWLEKAAVERGVGHGDVPVHLEIETGMARQGVGYEDGAGLSRLAEFFTRDSRPQTRLRLEGVMTHYASPESVGDKMNRLQTDRFAAALEVLRRHGARPEVVHAGNSDTLFDQEQMERLAALAAAHGARLMVRPGIELYGAGTQAAERGLCAALEWKTRVISVRELPAGETVGYGSTFTTARPTTIALVAAGYADGLTRSLGNRGAMLVRGQRAPIVGRISMDLATLDVTGIPGVAAGDEVVIVGQQGRERITAAEIAATVGTIPYEVVCGIAGRVPRVFVG